MESAFGVDHGEVGEIEKFGLGGLGTKMAGLATKGGNSLRRTGAANMRMGASHTAANPASGFGSGMQWGGQKRVQAGGALKKLGAGMAAKPGLTGGLAVGGGAAGVGGVGAGLLHRNRNQ